ncbi:MAG: T9SS type A sorting domain-containing protein, partial [Candidatus Neomarinimicrobiota bacterium]|nr:T9SS type A sorting domain-containing protein [Candidatus Neomarinimicrobiota bacterium]
GLAVTIQADESVYLTWDNDDNATSYQIQRSRDPMFFGPSDFFTSTENNYTDTDLTPGIRHYYTVSTYYGDYLSPSSQNVSALVVPAPVGVMVTVDESSVSLSWDAVDIAEVSYVIDRATDSLFTADVEEFTSTENSFTDNSLEADIEYYYRVSAVCCGGNSISFFSDIVSAMLTVMGTDLTASIPDAYSLQQNYPNPFNPTTKIRYGLKENTYVSINIYNLMGKHIRSYINTVQDAGYKTILWNATDASGQPVPAGMYIYSITAGDFRQTRKMILLK